MHKTSSGQAHFNSVVFNSIGVVDFVAGTLFLAGGGANTKTIAVPAGGVLRFSRTFSHPVGSTLTGPGAVHFEGGAHVMDGAYTVAGLTSIRGGTVSFPNEVSLPSAELSTGRLEGAGTVHLTGTASWTGGMMAGAGKTVVEPGASLTMSGTADKELNRAFENKGTVTWDNGRLVYRDGTFLNAGEMTIAHPIIKNRGRGSIHQLAIAPAM